MALSATIRGGAILAVLSLAAAHGAPHWEFPRFETRGSGYERGLQHGRRFQQEILADFSRKGGWGWSVGLPMREPGILRPFVDRLLALPNGKELLDEMQGIANGAGMALNDILGLNFTYDLNERRACSMALIPESAEGPLLLNTLDDFPSGKTRQNYPMFIQTAAPVEGCRMVFLCNYGTVWAHSGMNDAGLALASTSGGIGPPRNGVNYDGIYYALLVRYAIQFHESADDTAALFRANRQLTKGINVGVLDASGRGAIIEYSAFAASVRAVGGNAPLWATNHFQTKEYPPYPASIEKSDYMKNSRARYSRLGQLLAPGAPRGLALAQKIVCDNNDGNEGQICQDNRSMYTTSGYIYATRSGTAYIYAGKPDLTTPWVARPDALGRPPGGAPAPPSREMTAILSAKPRTLKAVYHRLKAATLRDPSAAEGRCRVEAGTASFRADLSAAKVLAYVPATLAEIPATSTTYLRGRGDADAGRFEAVEIVAHVPPHPWKGEGRCASSEASGLLRRENGRLVLTHAEGKEAEVTLDRDCRVFVAYAVTPAFLRDGAVADVFGHTLGDDGPLFASYLIVQPTTDEAAALRAEKK